MSQTYVTVQWNRHKRIYDLVLAGAVVLLIGGFAAAGLVRHGGAEAISPPILLMRAFGSAAVILLHVVLLIGPLARLDRRFAALLYNRRHLGVCLFLVALLHALAALGFYGAFGNRDPVTAILAGYGDWTDPAGFPFELLGAAALAILFLMAATSHDFWLATLGPRTWKSLHLGVYAAYALVLGHVALGVLQSETAAIYPILLAAGLVVVTAAHTAAAFAQARRERAERTGEPAGGATTSAWHDAGLAADLPEDAAVTIRPPGGGPAIAVYRHAGGISAVANQCAHQGGPLGEGRIVDGCITCPWHGYQYRPEDGCSPPPYTEKLPTYGVRLDDGRVLVSTTPNPPGTPVAPARLDP